MPPRYAIEDFYILDLTTQPVSRYYIRELLDYGCYEFESSKLNPEQKLKIINTLGLDVLTEVLAEYYRYTGKISNAKDAARYAWHHLNGTLKEMIMEDVEKMREIMKNDKTGKE